MWENIVYANARTKEWCSVLPFMVSSNIFPRIYSFLEKKIVWFTAKCIAITNGKSNLVTFTHFRCELVMIKVAKGVNIPKHFFLPLFWWEGGAFVICCSKVEETAKNETRLGGKQYWNRPKLDTNYGKGQKVNGKGKDEKKAEHENRAAKLRRQAENRMMSAFEIRLLIIFSKNQEQKK